MKIKNQTPRGLRIQNKTGRVPYHWWLIAERPKSPGRLSQLNKRNTKRRTSAGIFSGSERRPS